MIIKASRITTASGEKPLRLHVTKGAENEHIEILQGSEAAFADYVADARAHGAKYALRHIIVSPESEMTREQGQRALEALAAEFGFDPNLAIRVRHTKPRQGGQGFDEHEHFIVPEVDPVTRRVLDSSNFKRRNEKVARILEVEFGHELVKGKHNRAAVAALRRDGRADVAEKMEAAGLTQGPAPVESYTSQAHQVAKRNGLSMPELKAAVKAAWASENPLRELPEGVTVTRGNKPGVWIAEAEGADGKPVMLGAVHRLVKQDQAAVDARLRDLETAAPGVEPVAAEAAPLPVEPAPAHDIEPVEVAPVAAVEADAAPVVAAPAVQELEAPAAPKGEEPAPKAPAGGGKAPAGGSGAPVSDVSDADLDTPGPLDPTRPGDVARFLREHARWHAKKEKEAAARGRTGGQQNGSVDFTGLAEALHAAFAAGRTFTHDQALAVGYGGPARVAGGGAGPSPDAGAGQQGPEPRGVRRDEERRPRGRAAAPVVAAGAAAARGAVEDRRGARPAGEDRSEPSEAGRAAGRNRIQARQAQRALANAITPDREARLRALSARLEQAPTAAVQAKPIRHRQPPPAPTVRKVLVTGAQQAGRTTGIGWFGKALARTTGLVAASVGRLASHTTKTATVAVVAKAARAAARTPEQKEQRQAKDAVQAELDRLRAAIKARPENQHEVARILTERHLDALKRAQKNVEWAERRYNDHAARHAGGIRYMLGIGEAARTKRELLAAMEQAREEHDAAQGTYKVESDSAAASAPHRAQANKKANQRDKALLDAIEEALKSAKAGDEAAREAARKADLEWLAAIGRQRLEQQNRQQKNQESASRIAMQKAADIQQIIRHYFRR